MILQVRGSIIHVPKQSTAEHHRKEEICKVCGGILLQQSIGQKTAKRMKDAGKKAAASRRKSAVARKWHLAGKKAAQTRAKNQRLG